MKIAELHSAVAAICPIDGIASDRTIGFKPEATPEQRQAAQAMVDANDWNAPTPFAELKAAELLDFRTKREQYLNRVAGIAVAALHAGDTVTVQAAADVRAGLLDLPAHPAVVAATDIATLKAAIRTRYAEIVSAVPAAAKAAFKKVDS